MGNSIKCCIACMLPCGALDVVRVVHANGHVEEYSRPVKAGEVMKANPKHVLGLPSYQELVQKTVVLPPDAELQRGKIYFLIPAYTLQKHRSHKSGSHANNCKAPSLQNPSSTRRASERKVQKRPSPSPSPSPRPRPPLTSSQKANLNQSEIHKQRPLRVKQLGDVAKVVVSEQCVSQVVCQNEKTIKAQKDVRESDDPRKRSEGRRSSRFGVGVGVWKPALESISEDEAL